MWLGKILGWFALKDYDVAKERAATEISMRYGRGNVLFQDGSSIDDKELSSLSRDADKATTRLRKTAA